jgi:outer membrane biosynthesis protein TonB
MWNGAWFDPYVQDGKIHTFPPTEGLSTQWSATEDRICTLTPDLECADTQVAPKLPPERGDAAPQLAASALRATPADAAGKCIRCDYPHILVNEHFTGRATIKLAIYARPDGSVSSVEVLSSPTPDIGDALRKAVSNWIFYPVLRDGIAAPTKRTIDVPVMVIKPR